MPELPEVQTIVNDLNSAALPGLSITGALILWPPAVKPLDPDDFSQTVSNCTILSIFRRGKYIVMELSAADNCISNSQHCFLFIHLRMTGYLYISTEDPNKIIEQDPHIRVILHLSDKRCLVFHDTRKFGRLILTYQPQQILRKLGFEPLDPNLDAWHFHSMLQKRKGTIKALLLDQTVLAGIGNIYCDEALFAAGINPQQSCRNITQLQATCLLQSIRDTLHQGIRNRGTSLGNGETNYQSAGRRGENRPSLAIYGRTGCECIKCGTPIQKIYVCQRGTHFCPACQPLY